MNTIAQSKKIMLTVVIAAGLCIQTGCTDNDYDLNDVDMTIGIGGDELIIPTNSTDTIKLGDVLKLNNSETVVEQPNGDYYFQQEGDMVNPAHPSINKVTILRTSSRGEDLVIPISTYLQAPAQNKGIRRIGANINESATVQFFSYEGDIPQEVEELVSAGIESRMELKISFSSDLKAFVPTIAEMSIEMPDFLILDKVQTSASHFRQEGSMIVMTDIATSAPIKLSLSITKIDFAKDGGELGSLTTDNSKIRLNTNLRMKVGIREIDDTAIAVANPANCKISTDLNISDNVILSEVSGRFAPKIDLGNLGEASISGIPDFLTEDGVVIDLDNPQVYLNISSDLDIPGYVRGKLVAKKDNRNTATVEIPDILIKANADNHICICRDPSKLIHTEGITLVAVPTLSTLLNPIPDHISFEADVRADNTIVSSFKLGKKYTITPSYRIVAPLAFGENAQIVYTDSIDDISSDIEDIDVAEGTRLQLSADIVSRIPAYLNVSAVAVDVDGHVMPESQVRIDVKGEVKASPDGESETVSPLTITLTPSKGVLKRVNRIRLTISGSAKSAEGGNIIAGTTLNANTHSLVAKNITIKLVGKVIADLN